MKIKILLCSLILQVAWLINFNTVWATENEYRIQNDIHIRKGFTDWGDGQIREYKFRNVAESVGYLTMFPIENIIQKIPNEVLENWNIEYRIHTSIDDAELAMVERLDMSNLYMHNIIDSPLSKGPIGDNCWYQLSAGVIQFLRNNVFVSIAPNFKNSSFDSTTEWLAREVDTLIMASEKVDNENLIPSPNIISVDIISELPMNWEKTVDVKINAEDPNFQKLFYRKYATGFGVVSETGYLTLSFNKIADASEDTGKAKVKIWVWNEDFVTSSVQIEIPF